MRLLVALALAVAAVAVFFWGVELYRIPSGAMRPTLEPSDRVVVSRFHLLLGDPERGDLVAFRLPARKSALCGMPRGTFLDRVVGVPRDVVSERTGAVFVNGRRLREPYVARRYRDAMTHPARRVPAGHYFVMGDNRLRSCDSRVFGPIPREDLVGEAVAVYWPPGRIGLR